MAGPLRVLLLEDNPTDAEMLEIIDTVTGRYLDIKETDCAEISVRRGANNGPHWH